MVYVVICVLAVGLSFWVPERAELLLTVLVCPIALLHLAAANIHLSLAESMGRGPALKAIFKASPLFLRAASYVAFAWFATGLLFLLSQKQPPPPLAKALPTICGFMAWMAILDWRFLWWRIHVKPKEAAKQREATKQAEAPQKGEAAQ